MLPNLLGKLKEAQKRSVHNFGSKGSFGSLLACLLACMVACLLSSSHIVFCACLSLDFAEYWQLLDSQTRCAQRRLIGEDLRVEG